MNSCMNPPDEAPNFKGVKIEFPQYGAGELSDRQTAPAIDRLRENIQRFVQEVSFANPVQGRIQSGMKPDDMAEKPLSEAKIFVVDDDRAVSKSIHRALAKHFTDVAVFDDGLDVLKAIYSEGELIKVPHLVVSDTNMRHVHGPELAETLLKIDPSIRPRFMALTGDFTSKNIQQYVNLGIVVLEKPANPGLLLAAAIMELRQHAGFIPENK